MAKKLTSKDYDALGSKYNTASFKSAMKVEGIKKIWMAIDDNETHRYYESLGAMPMDYEYSPGLRFPGDLKCKNPKELEGCRCSIGYEVE